MSGADRLASAILGAQPLPGLGPVLVAFVESVSSSGSDFTVTVRAGELTLNIPRADCDLGMGTAVSEGDIRGRRVLVLFTPGREYFAIMLGG